MQRPCGDCGQKHEAGDETKPNRGLTNGPLQKPLLFTEGCVMGWRE
jgi:hypothetical protein